MRSNFLIVMRMRNRFMRASFAPHYATFSEKVTFGPSMRAGRPGQQQSPYDGEQLARIEVVAV